MNQYILFEVSDTFSLGGLNDLVLTFSEVDTVKEFYRRKGIPSLNDIEDITFQVINLENGKFSCFKITSAFTSQIEKAMSFKDKDWQRYHMMSSIQDEQSLNILIRFLEEGLRRVS